MFLVTYQVVMDICRTAHIIQYLVTDNTCRTVDRFRGKRRGSICHLEGKLLHLGRFLYLEYRQGLTARHLYHSEASTHSMH